MSDWRAEARAALSARLAEAADRLTPTELASIVKAVEDLGDAATRRRLLAELTAEGGKLTTGELRALVQSLKRRGAKRATGAPRELRLVGDEDPEDHGPPPQPAA